MQKPTTIYDIADYLGISAATVSRALGDNSKISVRTKMAVLMTAEILNYSQNVYASNLRKGKRADN